MGKSTLAVDVQNQWPLLPIIVATANEHDRRPLATFQRVFSSLFAWIRLYSEACNMQKVTTDEDIVQVLLPQHDRRKLELLDSILFTHFRSVSKDPAGPARGGAPADAVEAFRDDAPTDPPVVASVPAKAVHGFVAHNSRTVT
eukprot:RCo041111